MPKLRLVYDVASRAPDWEIMLLPMLLLAVGVGLFCYYLKVVQPDEINSQGFNKKNLAWVSVLSTRLWRCFLRWLSSRPS